MDEGRAVLGDRGVIEVAGPEARELLQRLITNDVEKLRAGQARYAALLTPQGKILADFFVVDAGGPESDRFLLDVAEALVPDLAKKLTLYRLRAKVTITDLTGTLGVVAFAAGGVPDGAVAVYDDPRSPALGQRAILPKPALDHAGDDAGRWAYRERRIAAGVPEGGIDFAYGETFPHEANLDRLHGLDFRKGCYVGQEVVSHVEHRGTARKRVVGLRFEGEPPPVGADVTSEGLSIGTMGSTVDGLGLALLRIDRGTEIRAAGRTVLAGTTPVTLDGPGWN